MDLWAIDSAVVSISFEDGFDLLALQLYIKQFRCTNTGRFHQPGFSDKLADAEEFVWYQLLK